MLYLLFKPPPEEQRDTDLELPEWAYDATPRDADEMLSLIRRAVAEATKDWDLERMEAWLAFRALEGLPKDELQSKVVKEQVDARRGQMEDAK